MFNNAIEQTSGQIMADLKKSGPSVELDAIYPPFAETVRALQKYGKELFESLDFWEFDLSVLPQIADLIKKGEANSKTNTDTVNNRLHQTALELDKITRDTSIKDLLGNLGMFLTNVLISSQKFKNYGDIVDYVIEREYWDDPSRTPRIRHLGDKSYQQLKNLVEAKGNLIKR